MSYLTSSSSPQAPSRRNQYELRTGNTTYNTYGTHGQDSGEYEIYVTSQPQTNIEPTSRRKERVYFSSNYLLIVLGGLLRIFESKV